jgi:hypothetical protein
LTGACLHGEELRVGVGVKFDGSGQKSLGSLKAVWGIDAEESAGGLAKQAGDGSVGLRAGYHADLLLVPVQEGGLLRVFAGGRILPQLKEAGGPVSIVHGLGRVHAH